MKLIQKNPLIEINSTLLIPKKRYQNLIKVDFRLNLDDWVELKLYRVSFGMPISAFLVYLLIADSVDFAEKMSYFTVFQYRESRYG